MITWNNLDKLSSYKGLFDVKKVNGEFHIISN